jgi:uncharacterized membrane protein
MTRHPRWVRSFLSDGELDAIATAVGAAEARTSAEIRVHLEARCPGDAMARAVAVFERLGMAGTAARNGVLIYVAVEDHKLAVIGDQGIHQAVGDAYWRRVVDDVVGHMRAGRPRDGLTLAVAEVGEALARYFPRRPDDRNELSDRVSLS